MEKWQKVKDRTTAKKILEKLADPNYIPVTTSELAVNELGMGGPLHWKYTQARDLLADLGFLIYAWGEPVRLSPEFSRFVSLNVDRWLDVLAGRAQPTPEPTAPAPPAPPAQPPPAVYPSLDEDDEFWDRLENQISPLLQSAVSPTGEVLYFPTARQGSRSTGGRYSRPGSDLCCGRPVPAERYQVSLSSQC